MNKAHLRSLVLRAWTLGLSLMTTFSEGGALPIYAQFGAGARPAGLGGAFTAIADDANSAIWNAANMVLASGPELTGTHTSSYMGSTFDCLAGILPVRLLGRRNSGGFYLLRATTDDIPVRVLPSDTASGVPPVEYGEFETVYAALGFGTRLSEFVLLGLTANILRARLLQSVASGRGFHVSLSVDVKSKGTPLGRTNVSVQVRDIGGRVLWSSGHTEFEPPRLVLAVAHRPWFDNRLILAADFERPLLVPDSRSDWRLGVEFLMFRSIPLRFGYDGESIAAGAGCRGRHVGLDYALSFHRDLAESHCVSVTLIR